jgi:hypothetical protein
MGRRGKKSGKEEECGRKRAIVRETEKQGHTFLL